MLLGSLLGLPGPEAEAGAPIAYGDWQVNADGTISAGALPPGFTLGSSSDVGGVGILQRSFVDDNTGVSYLQMILADGPETPALSDPFAASISASEVFLRQGSQNSIASHQTTNILDTALADVHYATTLNTGDLYDPNTAGEYKIHIADQIQDTVNFYYTQHFNFWKGYDTALGQEFKMVTHGQIYGGPIYDAKWRYARKEYPNMVTCGSPGDDLLNPDGVCDKLQSEWIVADHRENRKIVVDGVIQHDTYFQRRSGAAVQAGEIVCQIAGSTTPLVMSWNDYDTLWMARVEADLANGSYGHYNFDRGDRLVGDETNAIPAEMNYATRFGIYRALPNCQPITTVLGDNIFEHQDIPADTFNPFDPTGTGPIPALP